jgi:hypothetical protein
MYNLILYFRLKVFSLSFQLQIQADYSHLNLNHHPNPGTTQTLPHSLIISDPEWPGFFPFHRLAQVLKACGKRMSSLLLPHTWPIIPNL